MQKSLQCIYYTWHMAQNVTKIKTESKKVGAASLDPLHTMYCFLLLWQPHTFVILGLKLVEGMKL